MGLDPLGGPHVELCFKIFVTELLLPGALLQLRGWRLIILGSGDGMCI